MNSEERSNDGVALWSCPECAFTFDAAHTDTDGGGHSCPLCAEIDLESRLAAALARIAAVEARVAHWQTLINTGDLDASWFVVDLRAALAASPTPTGREPAIDEPKHGYHADGRGVDTKNCLVCYLAVHGPGPATPTEPTEETP